MKLIYENDNQISGKLIKAYKKDWNWEKHGGNYESGKNFLSIHWEVRKKSNKKVRLHVESPTSEKDLVLNNLKSRIIISILSKIVQIKENLNTKKGKIKIGSMLNYVNKNKSSEVFKIELEKNNLTMKERIDIIHNNIGSIIDEILKDYYLEEISNIFK